jgi:chromosome segregation ATPase
MNIVRQNICANSRTSVNCSGIVIQRGNILCDTCIENRKASSMSKRDADINFLTEKNKELEKELHEVKINLHELEYKNTETQNQLEEITKKYNKLKDVDSDFLQLEIQRLTGIIDTLTSQVDTLTKEKNKYEMHQAQINLDNEKLSIDIERLKGKNNMLTEQNSFLEKENNIHDNLNKELASQLEFFKKKYKDV